MFTPLPEVKELQQLIFLFFLSPILLIQITIRLTFISVKCFAHCQAHIAHLIAAAMLNFTTHDQHIKPQVARI